MLKFFRKINYINLIILLLLIVLSSLPFFRLNTLLEGTDAFFHLGRIENISVALRERLEIPVRSNLFFYNGYGSLESIMYPNLFIYIPGIIQNLVDNNIIAYNILYILINIFFVISMYFSTKCLTKNKYIAIMSIIIAALFPYRLFTLYIRAAVGELLAQIFIPMLILGFYELLFNNSKKWYILLFATTGILQSHIITLFHAFIVLFIITLFNIKKVWEDKERLKNVLKFILSTVLLNLWFLIPFIQYYLRNLYLPICKTPIWMSACSLLDYVLFFEANGYTASLILIICFVLTIIFFIKNIVNKRMKEMLESNIDKYIFGLFIFSIICLILASNLFPWEIIYSFPLGEKYISIIQFAFRYLGYVNVTLSISAVYFGYKFVVKLRHFTNKNIHRLILNIAVFICLVLSTFSFIVHYHYVLTTNEKPVLGYYVEYVFQKHKTSFYSGKPIYGDAYVDLPINYFEFYEVYNVDTNEVYKIETSPEGLIRINETNVNANLLSVRVREPMLWRICEILSLFSLVYILLTIAPMIIEANKKNKKEHYINGFMIRNVVFEYKENENS